MIMETVGKCVNVFLIFSTLNTCGYAANFSTPNIQNRSKRNEPGVDSRFGSFDQHHYIKPIYSNNVHPRFYNGPLFWNRRPAYHNTLHYLGYPRTHYPVYGNNFHDSYRILHHYPTSSQKYFDNLYNVNPYENEFPKEFYSDDGYKYPPDKQESFPNLHDDNKDYRNDNNKYFSNGQAYPYEFPNVNVDETSFDNKPQIYPHGNNISESFPENSEFLDHINNAFHYDDKFSNVNHKPEQSSGDDKNVPKYPNVDNNIELPHSNNNPIDTGSNNPQAFENNNNNTSPEEHLNESYTDKPDSNTSKPSQELPNINSNDDKNNPEANLNSFQAQDSTVVQDPTEQDTTTTEKTSILGKPVFVANITIDSDQIIFKDSSIETAEQKQCVQDCQSSSEYEPVCGTNNVTYFNAGKFKCARNCGVSVFIQHNGRCPTISSEREA